MATLTDSNEMVTPTYSNEMVTPTDFNEMVTPMDSGVKQYNILQCKYVPFHGHIAQTEL